MNKRLLFAAVFVLGLSLGIGGVASAATAKELKVIATPSVALYGEPFSWKVTGLQPGERVTLKAASMDARKILWASEAVFQADASGTVDVGRQAPVSGGYAEADIFGLLWSMKATNSDPKKPVAYRHDGVNGWMVDLTATNSVGTTATTRFRCVFQRPGEALVRVPLEQDGLRGFLYYPAEGGPFPGVIILGGSEGRLFEGWAQAFAANGFAALSLAWFGYQSLPEELVEIPLEYFDRAVVAMTPAAHMWEGHTLRFFSPDYKPVSSWSLGGRPLPGPLRERFQQTPGAPEFSDHLEAAGQMILEFLLALAPNFLQLQDLAPDFGADKDRFEKESSFCILSGLCVRYCAEVKKKIAVGYVDSGSRREIRFVPEIATKECPTCKECFSLCPTSYLQAAFVLTEALLSTSTS